VGALFVVSRLVLLCFDVPDSTLAGVNVTYAFEVQRAKALGLSFYDLHERNREEAEPSSSPVERLTEYPPLAILWMCAPTWFLDPVPKTGFVGDAQMRAAKQANRIAMFVVDLAGFALLFLVEATAVQFAVYAGAGLLLFPVLYDRLDLLVGVLILAAVALLVRGARPWAPLAVLAAAINYKLTPVLLTPLFILGDIARSWKKIAGRAALLAALSAAIFLPFFAQDGLATLGFLRYHATRGLQLESVWSTIPVALAALFQTPASVPTRYGAFEIESASAPVFRGLGSVALPVVIVALTVVLWRTRRVDSWKGASVFLLAAIASATVLSPQYLLWAAPVIAMWSGKRTWTVWGLFLATCALTTISYPFGYGRLLAAVQSAPTLPLATRLIGIAPLITRNLLLVMLTILCWRDMAQAALAGSTAPDATPVAQAARKPRARR
jgi:hypothetical protein